MNKALVVLLDKGHLKVYNLLKSKNNKKRINLVSSSENREAKQRLKDKISDQSGRFGIGNGENHNYKLEEEKRFIRHMADDINSLIKTNNYADWFFASEKSINNKILKLLDQDAKCCLKENIAADLINFHKTELITRFNF